MKIAISSGHGKYIRGASGSPVPPQLDEVDEARRVVERVAEYLRAADVEVETFHDNTSHDQSTNLDTIVDWHNDEAFNGEGHDYDVSCHFNAYDGSAHGTEVLYVTQEDLAAELSAAISAAGGFTNRGAKYRGDLKFLNQTDEKSVLIETCFCDHTGDSESYRANFDSICLAIAIELSGETAIPEPGPEPEPPRPPRPDDDIPVEDRPTLRIGDRGDDVEDLQRMIPRFTGEVDGDFGSITERNVIRYQVTRGLEPDGIVGQITWQALYDHKLPMPPPAPPPGALDYQQQAAIIRIANESWIADYDWDDRGRAPAGYTQGMALAFAQSYLKLRAGHPAVTEMARGRTSSDKDVFNEYRDEFNRLGMSNEGDGPDTLRHLYALMLGSGMRESGGEHCCGRDQSAENYDSETCEAGLFQTSYNASSASDPEFDMLMVEYSTPQNQPTCYLQAFSQDVECSSSDWESYGSGVGRIFQDLCKSCPAFAVETHALTLRNLCNHYGPVIRHEVELRSEANEMFQAVQDYMDGKAVSV
jgi:peptidoglycan hydrolase-like protein with peptidoglycan-binding domain